MQNLIASVMVNPDTGKPGMTSADWYEDKGYLFMDCVKADRYLPDLYVLMEGHWFTITTKHLLNKYRLKQDGQSKDLNRICIYGFSSAKQKLRIQLGVAFLKGYYTIFDLDKNRVGIAPNSDSSKLPAFKGDIPLEVLSRIYEQHWGTWLIFASIFLGWFLFVALGLHVWLVSAMGKDLCGLAVFLWLLPSVGLGLVMWYFMVPFFNKVFWELDNGIQPELDPQASNSTTSKLLYSPDPTDVDRDIFLTEQDPFYHSNHLHFYQSALVLALFSAAAVVALKQ